MVWQLEGKSALVCGSTAGIGKATAIELAKLGARITLMARNEAKLQQVVSELKAIADLPHDYIVVDFNDHTQVEAAIQNYLSSKPAFHILVNNNGGPPAGPILDARPESFLLAFEQHLLCNQVLVQSVFPGMKNAGYGRIINIISTSVKQPLHGLGVSNTIRAAVGNWAKTLANEVAKFGITVNNVLPGATLTGRLEQIIENKATKNSRTNREIEAEMLAEIPAARFAKPEEIAWAVCYLASPAAAYVNGINVPVDGGRTGNL